MSHKKQPKVFIAAGGSGGHLFSAQKLAESLKNKTDIVFIGKGLLKNPFFKKNSYATLSILSGPLSKNYRLFFSLGAIFLGCIQSAYYLITRRPDIVVGFGSFHTFPILFAAKILKKKVLLFEANCLIGQVNRIIASKNIPLACQLPLSKVSKKMKIVPVAPYPFCKLLTEDLKKKGSIPSILIFGGSQGASCFNEIFLDLAKEGFFKEYPLAVSHITGSITAKKNVEDGYKKLNVEAEVFSFVKDMKTLYQEADLIICRAGALTIAELLHYKKPAVLIPYPYAKDDHQRINASFFTKIGGGVFINQKDLSPQKLKKAIIELLETKRHLSLLQSLTSYQSENRIELQQLVLDLCKKTPTFIS